MISTSPKFFAQQIFIPVDPFGITSVMLRNFIDLRFPTVQNSREQYFVTVARNRCLLAFVTAFLLALLF